MPNPSSWIRLRAGLAAAIITLVAALAILAYARVGALHGAQVPLYVAMDGTLGLIHGSDVWLDGQKVGTVSDIDLKPPAAAPPRTVLHISILQSALNHFRTDASASVKSGGSLLGTPVLFVLSGTIRGTALRPADTLIVSTPATSASAQIDSTMRRIPKVLAGFTAVAQNASWILHQTAAYSTTPDVSAQLRQLERSAMRLSAMIGRPRLLTDSTLSSRVVRAISDADALQRALEPDASEVQGARRASLETALDSARDALAQLQKAVTTPDQTLAKLRDDSVIEAQLRRAVAQLNDLIADVKRHPLRYVPF